MKSFPYAIWLMPCAEQRAELEMIIHELSARFGTSPFASHATLCSGVWKSGEAELLRAIEQQDRLVPVELAAGGLDWTDHWSTWFFFRLQNGGAICEQASILITGSHPPAAGPHLSLMYRFQTEGIDREALREELNNRLPRIIRFDELALVRPAAGGWEDVASWKIASCSR
jgi:hypothetical protein